MSTQQYSQIPASYYGLEHYPYQQYMNGSQPQLGQTQTAQTQQPLTQQLLQAQTAQYQQPYGLYYMQQMQPGQLPLQGQQATQQATQYQQYQLLLQQQPQQTQQTQQQQQQQQPLVPQGTLRQADYAVHYPGYNSSTTSAPYGLYALYQQQAGAPQASSGSAAPLALIYGSAPSQQLAAVGQQPLTTSLITAGTAQSAASASTAATAASQKAAPAVSTKGSVLSDTLDGAANSTVGQYQPPGIRPRVTTTMWEDEKTLCYQVDANNVSVVRRADNNMINGTKLLNVAQMTRGRRDGILKLEKIRHVVKIGSMHLKGVWIPFERALAMAQREGIVDMLYPLFVRDIKRVIQTGVTPAVQSSVTPSKSSVATHSSYPESTSVASSNPNMSYYQLYPSQYPPASSTHGISAVPDASGGLSAPQQQQMAVQQQLYGYSQPSYYNQSYAYNQGTTGATAGASGSVNYSSYSQAPVYSSYAGYSQAAQGQAQLQKPYDRPQQGQAIASQPPHGSPGSKKEKEANKK